MALPEALGLIVLGFTGGAQIYLRSLLVSRRRTLAALAALAIGLTLAFTASLQYDAWRTDPVGQFLLPPHQRWTYFALYVTRRIFAPWAIAGAVGLFLAAAAARLNRRFDGRFFEDEEPFLFGLAVFLVGYPAFLFYLALMLSLGTLFALVFRLVGKARAPLYYLWIPVAVFAILITRFAVSRSLIAHFNI